MATLRILGTSVTLREAIREEAQRSLGCKIEYQIRDLQTAQRQAVLEPDTYDVYDQWFHDLDFAWPANVLQPIDVTLLHRWENVNTLPRTGVLQGATRACVGRMPCDTLYVQENGRLGRGESTRISMLPLTHNADSYVYDLDHVPPAMKGKPESWSWLVDEAWKGRVGLQSDASIGGLDARMALAAGGLCEFSDITNPSLPEIEAFTAHFSQKRLENQFRRFWTDDQEGAMLLQDPQIHIQTLWSSSSPQLLSCGRRLKTALPIEGYRGWMGGQALSRMLSGETLELAYAYLNWWLDGWPGAYLAREGLYTFAQEASKRYMTEDEWRYWYSGEPTGTALLDNVGNTIASPGDVRPGGSYVARMGNIACWVSIMSEHNYFVRKWDDVVNWRHP